MNFEKSNLNKEEKIVPRKLGDMFPYLKILNKDNEGMEVSKEFVLARHKFTEEELAELIEARASIAKQLGYEIIRNDDSRYFNLKKGDFLIKIEHYMIPSNNLYNQGRIGAFSIALENDPRQPLFGLYDGKILGSENKEAQKIFDELVNYFN